MPSGRFSEFQNNINRSKELIGLGEAIHGLTVGVVDASDMYRAALVHAVAALDSYVHDVALDHAVAIVLGSRSPGSESKIGLHFGTVADILAASTASERELRAREAINARLSRETFQQPEDIAKVLSVVGVPAIWSTAFGSAGAKAARTALSLVVRRRNIIVHRCDVDPTGLGGTYPLSKDDAVDAVATVENTVCAVNACI